MGGYMGSIGVQGVIRNKFKPMNLLELGVAS